MNHRGFSLLELNVCCVMIALLSVISYPQVGKMKRSVVLKKEARELYCNLQCAKIEAVKRNCRVVFLVHQKGYTIFVDNGAGGGKKNDWKKQAGEPVLITHIFANEIELASTTFTANRTCFGGTLGLKAGRVILQNTRGRKAEVVVSTVGRIRIANVSA